MKAEKCFFVIFIIVILGSSNIFDLGNVYAADAGVIATGGGFEKTFEFPAIPPKIVWHGSNYEFLFSWPGNDGASFTFTCDQCPAGDLTLTTGLDEMWVMSYTPDATDTSPFMVTLTGETATNIRKQTFELIPTAHLASEQVIFDIGNHLGPGPFQAEDVIEHYTNGDVKNINNQGNKQLKVLTLVGNTIIWDDELISKYNGKLDQELITMTADTVIIRSALSFPQTNIVINARVLKFEGASAKISTTPNVTYGIPPQSGNGVNGWPAGNITLNIETFESGTSGTKFDLRGSKGQAGGPGLDGVNGTSVSTSWTSFGINDTGVIYYWYAPAGERIIFQERWNVSLVGIPIFFSQDPANGSPPVPTNGTNAIAPGRPGKGGTGGVLKSTLAIAASSSYANVYGGAGGDRPRTYDYKGGNAGTPNKWLKMKADYGWLGLIKNFYETDSYKNYTPYTGTIAGTNQSILYAYGSTAGHVEYPGSSSYPWTGDPMCWIDPIIMGGFFNDAKDLYLSGDMVAAKDRLEDLSASIANYKDSAYWGNALPMKQQELSQMYDHMQTLLYQIENRLDYFGNPAGWVPMLSFEVNLSLFESEIDRAIEQLYLAHWVSRSAKDSQGRLDSLSELRKKLQDDIDDAYVEFEDARNILPSLRSRSVDVKAKSENLILEIQALEVQLAAEADVNLTEPWWKTGLKMAGMIIKQVPFVQPLGEAFYIAADFDTSDPYGEALKITSVADQFVESAIEDSASAVGLAASAAAGDVGDTVTGAIEMIGDEMPNMTEYLTDGVELLSSRKAPVSEIEVEMERLKALSPDFKVVAEKMEKLISDQRELRYAISEAMLTMTTDLNIIRESLLAMDALQDSVASLSVPDDRALQYLKLIERRAFDRLLKYHYYVAKSYEYRLLEEYTEPLELEDLFYELSNNTQIGTGNNIIPADQFASLKGIYTDIISTIVNKIASDYNDNGVSASAAPLRFNLTAKELACLNDGETITLNLMDIPDAFPLYEENSRILDIAVFDIQTTPLGGAYKENAYVEIYIQHNGLSKLIKDGEIYLFQHFTDASTNPFKWGAWYYANDDNVIPITPSPSSTSLLHSILSTGGNATSENLMLYSRPSVWSEFSISMRIFGNAGNDIQLDSLRLEVLHDFERQNSLASIRTKVASVDLGDGSVNMDAEFMPYVNIGIADINGRLNGRGPFYRSYYPSSLTPVGISAQRRYAGWKFWRWADEYGNLLTTDRVLSILPDEHKVAMAQYVSIDELPGDLNYDCTVDIQDILMISKSWILPHGQLNLDDDDSEGMITIEEIAVITNNWLNTCDEIYNATAANSPVGSIMKAPMMTESRNVLVPDSERQLEFVYE